MGAWDAITSAIQKPQALMMGGIAGLGNQIGNAFGMVDEDEEELERIFKDLDDAGVDVKEFEHLRPVARSFLSGIGDAWSRNDVTPSRIKQQSRPVEEWDDKGDILDEIINTGANISMDPLAIAGATGATGAVASRLPGVAGKIAGGANTFGKLEKGTDLATRAGTYGRRGVQGLLASNGNPVMALGSAVGIGAAEKGG